MEEITDNGVRFKWYLAGPQGAAFLLFPDLHHTQEDIQQAKAEIRHNSKVCNEVETWTDGTFTVHTSKIYGNKIIKVTRFNGEYYEILSPYDPDYKKALIAANLISNQ